MYFPVRISRENLFQSIHFNLTIEYIYIHFENGNPSFLALKTASAKRHTHNSYAIDFESSEILSINVNVSDI